MADRDPRRDYEDSYRPERALVWGMLSGAAAVLCCLLWVLSFGKNLNSLMMWTMPLAGAAAASGVAALKKGSSLGRSVSVSVFASIITFSFSMVADYLYLVIAVTGPDLPRDSEFPMDLLKVKLAVSLCAVILGAVFGIMLGKNKKR